MARGELPKLAFPRRKPRKEPVRPVFERPGRHCVVCWAPKEPGSFPICDRCRQR